MSTRLAPPKESVDYRPLEPLAIVAVLFGLASVLIFYLDTIWYLFIVPIPGVMLAYIVRRRIIHSQGQIGGYAAATVALILSLVSLVGWVTNYYTARWIIESEAKAFADQFLQKVQTGKEGEAFLDTVKPSLRNINFPPTDLQRLKRHFPPPKGGIAPEFDVFRNTKLMTLLFRSGSKAQIRAAARPTVRSKVEGEFYDVKFNYILNSPYTNTPFTLTVASDYENIPSGRRRSWYIVITNQEIGTDESVTDYGKEVKDAEEVAAKGVQYLASLISLGDREKINRLFKNLSTEKRKELDQLIAAIRQDAPAVSKVEFGVRMPLLVLRETKSGPVSWQLTVQSQFEPANREVEFELTMETNNLSDEQKGWTFTDVRFLGERRKFAPQMNLAPPPPVSPSKPEIPR